MGIICRKCRLEKLWIQVKGFGLRNLQTVLVVMRAECLNEMNGVNGKRMSRKGTALCRV